LLAENSAKEEEQEEQQGTLLFERV